MRIYVCRNGEDIGDWEEEGFRNLVSRGEILPTDYYFHEGLSDWVLVSNFQTPSKPRQPETEPQKKSNESRDWRSDPATEKQINYLASFGVATKPALTKGEASDLREHAQDDPTALE